jgi:hypothetical protein
MGQGFWRVLRSTLAVTLLFAGTAFAQDASQEVIGGGPPVDETVVAPKIASASIYEGPSINIDGKLDDAVWRSAQWFDDFVQKDPEEGAVPSQRTEVAFTYDEDALYIAARMFDSDPDQIIDLITKRDQGGRADIIVFSLDTYVDGRTAYTFGVTAGGVRVDWYHPQDQEYRRDHTFNPVWEADAQVDSLGWTVEARIPFSQLRFNEGVETWGLNVNRWMPGRNEDIYWVMVPRDETGWSSRMGTLNGLASIEPKPRMELSPYIASDIQVTSSELINGADPFASTSEFTKRIGADFKMGVGPNLTLDATVNPDFGQVDADPAIVNLTAFETFFPERRPFFTEGSQLLSPNGAIPGYFYSRRIGANPHGFASSDFQDRPDVTTIVGAGKLTGRLGSGLSIGALGALTSAENATTYDITTDTFGETSVEPATGFGVVRLQQEFGEDASTVGFVGTAVTRSFDADDSTRDFLNSSAFTGGGDFNLRFQGGKYVVRGHAGLSYVAGSQEAIASLQQRSVHYFQRPDQDHVSFDPTRTSMLGGSASLQVEKNSGEHWLYNVGIWGDSPGWELNDIGRLSRADDLQSWGGLTYRETTPGKLFRNYNIRLNGSSGWNFGGVRTGTSLRMNTNATFLNYWSANLSFNHNFSSMSDRQTRGGPLMGNNAFWGVNGRVGNSHTAPVRVRVNGFWGNRNFGTDYSVGMDVSFDPTDQIRVSIGPEFSRFNDKRQFFTSLARETGSETFGTRYIFSEIQQSQISIPIRVNYAFDPDMSLEFWAQPFAASGDFSGFGELPEAQSFDLRTFGTDGTTITREEDGAGGHSFNVTDGPDSFSLGNGDFRSISFRSNLVFRWELRPGSTLFLVWQQNLSQFSNDGRSVGTGDLLDTFGAPGSNVLAVKMSYWLPM